MRKPHAAGFIASRWRGEASATVIYWRDILAVGSLINLFTGFAALMLAAQGVNLLLVAGVHFAVLPYNVFLVIALWRTQQRTRIMAWTSLMWLGPSPFCEGEPGSAKAPQEAVLGMGR